MEKVVRVFRGFEEADAADAAEDMAMTPEQRVAIVFELQARLYPDAALQGFARIYRLVQRKPSAPRLSAESCVDDDTAPIQPKEVD